MNRLNGGVIEANPSSLLSVLKFSEFLATDPELPGSISGATRFSEK
jgi:hypothetical protein